MSRARGRDSCRHSPVEAVEAAQSLLNVQVRGPAATAALPDQSGVARAAGDAVAAGGGTAVEGEAVPEAGERLDVVEDRAAASSVEADGPTEDLRVADSPGELDPHEVQYFAGVLRVLPAVDSPLGGRHVRRDAIQTSHWSPAEDPQTAPAARLAPGVIDQYRLPQQTPRLAIRTTTEASFTRVGLPLHAGRGEVRVSVQDGCGVSRRERSTSTHHMFYDAMHAYHFDVRP